MLRPNGVTNHIARSTIKERRLDSEQAFFEHMREMHDGISAAIDQIMTAGVDHLIIGIALETFWGGVPASDTLQNELARRAGVGVTLGSIASVGALNEFAARRIAVLTPHQPRGDDMVRLFLTEAGFDVVRLKGLKCASPRAIAEVTAAEIRTALQALDGPDVDALLQVGTALPAVAVAAEAERWLGKPVLAINAVSYRDALRRCGIEDRVYGFGRILEEF
jgi:maleate isomerase